MSSNLLKKLCNLKNRGIKGQGSTGATGQGATTQTRGK
jgi:hypothetical protein